MPIYEYACGACGHEFEEWQKMSDPPVRTCPKCKKKKVERLISQTAFQLKGGGWYADLYSSSKPGKSEGGSDAGGDTSAGKDSPSGKSETKSESKSEAKSDSKGESKSKSSDTSSKKDSKASSPKKSETRAA